MPELEDFSLVGLEALAQHLAREPGYKDLRERIWQEGREAGREEAAQAAATERQSLVADTVNKVEELLAGLAEERSRFLELNAGEIVQLALALARRVMRVQVRVDAAVLEEKLRVCLHQLDRDSSYLIRVNPDQLRSLELLLARAGRDLFGETPFRMLGDRRVPAGGIILEGDRARLESICEDELERLEEHLQHLIHEGGLDDER
jgi:flagellar assembly protein FliH